MPCVYLALLHVLSCHIITAVVFALGTIRSWPAFLCSITNPPITLRNACDHCRKKRRRCISEHSTTTPGDIAKGRGCRGCKEAGATCTYTPSTRATRCVQRDSSGAFHTFIVSANSPSTSCSSAFAASTEHGHGHAVAPTSLPGPGCEDMPLPSSNPLPVCDPCGEDASAWDPATTRYTDPLRFY